MALPFDALTAALDAWLVQHIPHETRRARVRRSVDCLDDLRLAPLAHIEFATDLESISPLVEKSLSSPVIPPFP